MPLTKRPNGNFGIEGVLSVWFPEIREMQFGEGRIIQNNKFFNWPQAAISTREEGSTLQSAKEAVVFRIAANETPELTQDSNYQQFTRTYAVYFQHNGQWYIAIDDHPNDGNVLFGTADIVNSLSIEQKVKTYGFQFFPRDDKYVKRAIEKAYGTHRLIRLDGKYSEGEFSRHAYGVYVKDARGLTYEIPFAEDQLVQAILGREAASLYADFKKNSGNVDHYMGRIILLSIDSWRDKIRDQALVTPISLGSFDHKFGSFLPDADISTGHPYRESLARGILIK